jgi:chromosomal replication initiator protein
MNIIHYKASENNISLPEEAVSYIAEKVIDNVRDIEGIVVSLAAEVRLNRRDLDMSLVRRIVSRTVRIKTVTPSIPRIRDIVCRYFDIDCTTFQGPSRTQEVVLARQIAMHFAKKYTGKSLSAIGDEMGHRNHTSVLYALKTIQGRIEVDKPFRASVETIENLIKNG